MSKEVRAALFLSLTACAIAAFAFQKQDPVGLMFGQPHDWMYVEHESGAKYLIRSDVIIGFYEPISEDKYTRRNEVLLSGRRVLHTNIDLNEFIRIGVESGQMTGKLINFDEKKREKSQ